MDIHKLIHEACGASGHWHLPLFVGLIGSIKLHTKIGSKDDYGDLGEAPGDNILPKAILNSLISRRSL
jgi:hypothetical protein